MITQFTPATQPSAPKLAAPIRTATAAERAERQSELLDEGLLETFPASDPVSVVRL